MKNLCIIVPKGSLLDFYVRKYHVYGKITERNGSVYYKETDISNPLETISYLIVTFKLFDFSINCNYGDYTFRVRS